jgi:hypothetical protein
MKESLFTTVLAADVENVILYVNSKSISATGAGLLSCDLLVLIGNDYTGLCKKIISGSIVAWRVEFFRLN